MNKSNIIWIILCAILLITNISTFIYFGMDDSSANSISETSSEASSFEEVFEESSVSMETSEENSIDTESSEEPEEQLIPVSSFYECLCFNLCKTKTSKYYRVLEPKRTVEIF